MVTSMEKTVISFLQQAQIPFELSCHAPVYTMAEMSELGLDAQGPIPKNLFLRDGKGRQHFLITADRDTAVDLKALEQLLEAKKLGFASPQRLEQYLGISAGCVSPLGVLNDKEHAVTVVFDRKLAHLPRLGVHPNVHDATLWLSFADLCRAVELAGNEVRILDL